MTSFIPFSGENSPIRQQAIIALVEILRTAVLEAMKLEGTKEIDSVIKVEVPGWLCAAVTVVQGRPTPLVLGRPIHAYGSAYADVIRVFFADNVQSADGPTALHHHDLLMIPEPEPQDYLWDEQVVRLEELLPPKRNLELTLRSSGLSFGDALRYLKQGGDARVRRAGWNGKGMWLRMVDTYTVRHELSFGADRPAAAPWIGMKTADNKFVPWLASQTDILAEDWETVT